MWGIKCPAASQPCSAAVAPAHVACWQHQRHRNRPAGAWDLPGYLAPWGSAARLSQGVPVSSNLYFTCWHSSPSGEGRVTKEKPTHSFLNCCPQIFPNNEPQCGILKQFWLVWQSRGLFHSTESVEWTNEGSWLKHCIFSTPMATHCAGQHWVEYLDIGLSYRCYLINHFTAVLEALFGHIILYKLTVIKGSP